MIIFLFFFLYLSSGVIGDGLEGNASPCPAAEIKDEAFVTLLYGDEFLLPIRVLGRSLAASGTTRGKLVMVTTDVSHEARSRLERDCWTVFPMTPIDNPFHNAPKRFSKVLTKLRIWTLTQYKKVVYLDGDTIVSRNPDKLFNCITFCASVRHSDKFNTGVMVLKPSEETYKDMMEKLPTATSYTGADQGFLNTYFKDLHKAPEFDSDTEPPADGIERLSAIYNADEGMYYLQGGRWLFDPPDAIVVLHYTFGPVRPWYWYSYPMFPTSHQWMVIRDSLNEEYDGLGEMIYYALPYLLLVVTIARMLNRSRRKNYGSIITFPFSPTPIKARIVGGMTCLFSGFSATYFVPRHAKPDAGLNFFLVLTYTLCLAVGLELWAISRTQREKELTFEIRKHRWRIYIKLLLSTAAFFSLAIMTFYGLPNVKQQLNRILALVCGVAALLSLIGFQFQLVLTSGNASVHHMHASMKIDERETHEHEI